MSGNTLGARSVAFTGGVRALTLPITAACSLATAGLSVRALGVAAYGAIALLAALPAMLPVTDLGVGTAVTNAAAAAASDSDSDGELEAVMRGAFRVLAWSGMILAVVGMALAVTGLWSYILPSLELPKGDVNVALGGVALLTGACLPLSIATRLLVGLGRAHLSVAASSCAAPIALLAVAGATIAGAPAWIYALAPPLGLLAGNAFAWHLARNHSNLLKLSILRPRAGRCAAIAHSAAPMALILLSQAAAIHSDRIVIAARSSPLEVSKYALGFQLYSPAISVVGSAGLALWPMFARTEHSLLQARVVRWIAAFASVGIGIGVAFCSVGPAVLNAVAASSVFDLRTAAAFSALLVAQAMTLPLAMRYTDLRGLRVQAVLTGAMFAVNLPLSIFLAPRLGASGPLWASAATVVLFHFTPLLLLSRFGHSVPRTMHGVELESLRP